MSTYAHRVGNCSGEYLDGKYTDEIARLISLTLGDRVLSGSKGNSNATHKGHCCAAHCVMRPSIEEIWRTLDATRHLQRKTAGRR